MASVILDFVPPLSPGVTKLHIYEAPTQGGVFSPIETVEDVGTYPTYISQYSTDQATSTDNWFAIQWEDDKGVRGDLSAPIQGNTTTLIGRIVSRVLLRDPTIDENVAVQEAEAAVAAYYGVDDPYTITTFTYPEISGLTWLTMARAYIGSLVVSGSAGDSYTAGLVSQKSSSGSTADKSKMVEEFINLANSALGLNLTYVALLQDIDPLGIGTVSAIEYDQSRLTITEIP